MMRLRGRDSFASVGACSLPFNTRPGNTQDCKSNHRFLPTSTVVLSLLFAGRGTGFAFCEESKHVFDVGPSYVFFSILLLPWTSAPFCWGWSTAADEPHEE